MTAAVRFEAVDVVFGGVPRAALPLLDAGETRETIQARTGQVVAVHGASLAVPAGRITVLMGLSGSGKSTLLRCVNGLVRVTRGRVLVEDADGASVDVGSAGARTRRRLRQERVAMVFQSFALLPWRTVAENVGLGLELKGVDAASRRRIVAEKLELVGLADWADTYAHQLSGGMQQRVGLARALATDAPILLMDEPFSALDPLIRDRLQNDLLELQDRLGKTILFVSHDLDEAMKLGHQIAIMEAGRIVQAGSPEAIVTAPATSYVADFVANLNPLNVLSTASIMAPLAEWPRAGDALVLDDGLHVSLDGAGRPQRLWDGAGAVATAANGHAAPGEVVLCRPETRLREVVELRRRTGRPILIADAAGRIHGAVGERQLLDGVLNARGTPARA